MSLWIWRSTSSYKRTEDKSLSSSSERTLWARPISMAGPVQTLSPFFSFPLQVQDREGNSSIDAVGEGATRVRTGLEMTIPILILVFTLLARGLEILDKGSSLFPFSRAYLSTLKRVAISVKDKENVKQSMLREKSKTTWTHTWYRLFSLGWVFTAKRSRLEQGKHAWLDN